MKTLALLKEAHARLKPGYKTLIIALLLISLITAAASFIFGLIFAGQILDAILHLDISALSGALSSVAIFSILMGILSLFLGQGILAIALKIARGEPVSLETLFSRFKDWKRIILLSCVQTFLLWLWALLLLIPAYIKAFSYSQSFYILLEDENIGVLEAITKSRQMMNGHKLNMFVILLLTMLMICVVAIVFTFIPYVGMPIFMIGAVLYISPLLMVAFSVYHLFVADSTTPPQVAVEPPAITE